LLQEKCKQLIFSKTNKAPPAPAAIHVDRLGSKFDVLIPGFVESGIVVESEDRCGSSSSVVNMSLKGTVELSAKYYFP